jgi:hypothetical protein
VRRDLLIAFSGGAALSAAVSIAGFLLVPTEPIQRPVLIVYDKKAPLMDVQVDPSNALTAGRLMHGCGSKNFVVKQAGTTDASNYIEAPLSDESLASVTCAVKKASSEDFDFTLASKNPS